MSWWGACGPPSPSLWFISNWLFVYAKCKRWMVEPWAGEELVVLPLPHHGLYITDCFFMPKVSVGWLNRKLVRSLWSSLSLTMFYIYLTICLRLRWAWDCWTMGLLNRELVRSLWSSLSLTMFYIYLTICLRLRWAWHGWTMSWWRACGPSSPSVCSISTWLFVYA